MTESTFLHEIKGRVIYVGDWALSGEKPAVLWNEKTGVKNKFKNPKEAFDKADIDGKPLKDIVLEAEYDDLFPPYALIDDSDIKIRFDD